MGRYPKPKDQASGHRTKSELDGRSTSVTLPAAAGGLAMPEELTRPTGRWLKKIKDDWAIIWNVAESSMLRPHHVTALRRLYDMYDELERMERLVRKKKKIVSPVDVDDDGHAIYGRIDIPGHLEMGSQGQLVESVESKKVDRLRREVRQMEDRFAGTPMAQFRLGWQQAAMLNEQARAAEATAIARAAAEIRAGHEQREVEVLGTERDE
jgi:hypothetical protein